MSWKIIFFNKKNIYIYFQNFPNFWLIYHSFALGKTSEVMHILQTCLKCETFALGKSNEVTLW